MLRTVFCYCTLLVFLKETVYSKPQLQLLNSEENIHSFNTNDGQFITPSNVMYTEQNGRFVNNDQTKFIFSKPQIEDMNHHQIQMVKDPQIQEISNEVARFIMYFIKKYCKNGNNMGLLQQLLATKGIGNIFSLMSNPNIKTINDANNQPQKPGNIAFFDNEQPSFNNEYQQKMVPHFETEQTKSTAYLKTLSPDNQQHDQMMPIGWQTEGNDFVDPGYGLHYNIPEVSNGIIPKIKFENDLDSTLTSNKLELTTKPYINVPHMSSMFIDPKQINTEIITESLQHYQTPFDEPQQVNYQLNPTHSFDSQPMVKHQSGIPTQAFETKHQTPKETLSPKPIINMNSYLKPGPKVFRKEFEQDIIETPKPIINIHQYQIPEENLSREQPSTINKIPEFIEQPETFTNMNEYEITDEPKYLKHIPISVVIPENEVPMVFHTKPKMSILYGPSESIEQKEPTPINEYVIPENEVPTVIHKKPEISILYEPTEYIEHNQPKILNQEINFKPNIPEFVMPESKPEPHKETEIFRKELDQPIITETSNIPEYKPNESIIHEYTIPENKMTEAPSKLLENNYDLTGPQVIFKPQEPEINIEFQSNGPLISQEQPEVFNQEYEYPVPEYNEQMIFKPKETVIHEHTIIPKTETEFVPQPNEFTDEQPEVFRKEYEHPIPEYNQQIIFKPKEPVMIPETHFVPQLKEYIDEQPPDVFRKEYDYPIPEYKPIDFVPKEPDMYEQTMIPETQFVPQLKEYFEKEPEVFRTEYDYLIPEYNEETIFKPKEPVMYEHTINPKMETQFMPQLKEYVDEQPPEVFRKEYEYPSSEVIYKPKELVMYEHTINPEIETQFEPQIPEYIDEQPEVFRKEYEYPIPEYNQQMIYKPKEPVMYEHETHYSDEQPKEFEYPNPEYNQQTIFKPQQPDNMYEYEHPINTKIDTQSQPAETNMHFQPKEPETFKNPVPEFNKNINSKPKEPVMLDMYEYTTPGKEHSINTKQFMPQTEINVILKSRQYVEDPNMSHKQPKVFRKEFEYTVPEYKHEINLKPNEPVTMGNNYQYTIHGNEQPINPNFETQTEINVVFKPKQYIKHLYQSLEQPDVLKEMEQPEHIIKHTKQFNLQPENTQTPIEYLEHKHSPNDPLNDNNPPKLEETLHDMYQPQQGRTKWMTTTQIINQQPEKQVIQTPMYIYKHTTTTNTENIPSRYYYDDKNNPPKTDEVLEPVNEESFPEWWTENINHVEHNQKPKDVHFDEPKLKIFADDAFDKYTIELENLSNMKPLFKKIASPATLIKFSSYIDQMKDVINKWKNGGKFYDRDNINYVTKTISQLSNDTINILKPTLIEMKSTNQKLPINTYTQIITTTVQTDDDLDGERRTFYGEELDNNKPQTTITTMSNFLEEFDSTSPTNQLIDVDPEIRNTIIAYIILSKKGKNQHLNDAMLILLHKLRYLIKKYRDLFNKLNWIDREIDVRMKDPNIISPQLKQILNDPDTLHQVSTYLIENLDPEILKDFNIDSKKKAFFALLNIPVNSKSMGLIQNVLEKLLKEIITEIHNEPELGNIEFVLELQNKMDKSPFFKELKSRSKSLINMSANKDKNALVQNTNGGSLTDYFANFLSEINKNVEISKSDDQQLESINSDSSAPKPLVEIPKEEILGLGQRRTNFDSKEINYLNTDEGSAEETAENNIKEEEIIITPSPKKIEKHNNIFRQYLMEMDNKNTD